MGYHSALIHHLNHLRNPRIDLAGWIISDRFVDDTENETRRNVVPNFNINAGIGEFMDSDFSRPIRISHIFNS
jgi:hypothetical protein